MEGFGGKSSRFVLLENYVMIGLSSSFRHKEISLLKLVSSSEKRGGWGNAFLIILL